MTLHPPPSDPAGAAAAAARFAATAPADVAYAELDTPVGRLLAAATERGLVRLAYVDDEAAADAVLTALATRLSPRVLEQPRRLDRARRELDEYFARRRTRFDLPVDPALIAPFGRRVLLEATAEIPFGATRTYGEVAALAGNPRASRAAGRALGANPVPIVVPCHRVVGASGRLTGYTGGMHRKEALLRLEGVLA